MFGLNKSSISDEDDFDVSNENQLFHNHLTSVVVQWARAFTSQEES